MNIQPKSFHIAIGIAERLASKIENRVLIMNDSMVVGTQNHDIACVIIQASNKVIDMVSMDESRPIGFSNKFTANLASESIGDFQILADGFSQMANLAHPWIGAGNNPMVGMTVAVAVAVEEASK